ncbi:MAG TPA: hypothetical protein VEA44_16530 [Caulobacter sp.]|nr:hypothetical protein [Caulobacter sp.]
MTDVPPPVTFLDNPLAPDIFADEAAGFFVHEGVVRIALSSARIDHVTSPGPMNRVVVGRVVMSVPAAQRLCLGLYDFLKQQGYDPSDVVGMPSGAVQ